jgi:hypothetical protein
VAHSRNRTKPEIPRIGPDPRRNRAVALGGGQPPSGDKRRLSDVWTLLACSPAPHGAFALPVGAFTIARPVSYVSLKSPLIVCVIFSSSLPPNWLQEADGLVLASRAI